MHGIIFGGLKKFCDQRLGVDAWSATLERAGLAGSVYLSLGKYPDADAVTIITELATTLRVPVKRLLEDFGEFISADLLAAYKNLIRPEWRTLDVLEHTEETIHQVIRRRDPDASPPELRTVRNGSDVLVSYNSARRLCGVAIGIVRGLAKHYGERAHIDELSCMLKGAPSCRIRVRVASSL